MLLLSIVATETSTVTFLSLPGKSFAEGGNLTFLQLTFGYIVGRCLVVWLLMPLFFSGEFFTAYEVLQQRFGPSVRSIASLIFVVMRNAADGIRLFLTALLINVATGFDLVTSVVILAAATAAYAAVGGVTSVVINDCIQFAAYMLGAVVALAVLAAQVPDGWAGIAEFGAETGRWRLLDFSTSFTTPSITFWSGVIGGAVLTMATHGADHMMVQRYLCARSRRGASWALALSGPLVAAQFLLFLVIGVGLAYWQATSVEEITIDRPDRAFISFIVSELAPGFRGLVIASVLAASMSTLSSSLNASAGVLVKDLGGLWRRRGAGEGDVAAARAATVLFAVLQAGVAISAYYVLQQSVIDGVLAIAGFTTGVVLGLYLLGLALGRTSEAAAIRGVIAGIGVCWFVAFEMEVSWPWYSLIASGTTFAVGFAYAAGGVYPVAHRS